jgi:ABC-type multidrug transport system fused ATPase/permease subunit
VVQEAFGGFKDVKLLGLEQEFLSRFRSPSYGVARAEADMQVFAETPRFAMQGMVFSGMILAVLYILSSDGSLESALPSLAGFAFAGFRLLPSLQAMYAKATELRFGKAFLDSVHEELVQQPATRIQPSPEGGDETSAGSTEPLIPRRCVELQNITFRYPSAEHVAVDRLSISIPACTTVGIVGSTGSGKTTLVDLLLGLLRPEQGRILVDGTEVRDENLRAWQRTLGYVPQQIFLTDSSVASNIAFGDREEDIDMDRVIAAARIANLHDFVLSRMDDGYRTLVGERGIRLSGGQRQRIGIARALYRDPSVLVMDEATSALDNITERAVMEAIDRLEGEKTIVLIAHRLSTVKACDQIVMLDRGHLVAAGTWDELTERSDQFRALAAAGEDR